MAVSSDPQRLTLPLAPLVAGIIGVLTAAMFALIPTELLESMVVDSGVASVLSAAEPPLGFTARAALVLLCGGGVAVLAWFGLFLTFGGRTVTLRRPTTSSGSAPVLRRADAHPDAPARRPLFANTDLGTPFLEVRARPVHLDAAEIAPLVERPLPVDLDEPLSAYDPNFLRDTATPEPVASKPLPLPRRQTFDPSERFETFPLGPVDAPAIERRTPSPIARPDRSTEDAGDPSETIHALLDRLERVVSRRDTAQAPNDTIEDTLGSLRRMATDHR
ncbi:hypothetical protein [Sphingomonas sp. PAMC 26605]|uniref:hypothetical protein n=1 Tax=Sphingomonas sp. PAMC 26605 TaxID=1112214 RepID=UPI00026CD1B5|nr:hypothetical protein [Sphingomonas sp. PAMC 26605]